MSNNPRTVEFSGTEGITLVADEWNRDTAASGRPTILMLHGGGQNRFSWKNTGQILADTGLHVIALDTRGHGDSDRAPDADYAIETLTSDILHVLDAIGRPVVLIGASMGGLTGILVADSAGPDRVTGLVLVDVVPKYEKDGSARIRDFMFTNLHGFATLEEAADAVATYLPHRTKPRSPEGLKKNLRLRDGRWYWHWDPAMMTAPGDDPELRTENFERAAMNLTIPILLIRGKLSDVVSSEGLADERDALVLDHQVHHSVHVGANQARISGTRVELVRHDHLDQACDTISKLASKHRRVWFCVDGVYSMYGDLAPTRLLQEVLATSPNVRLYVDDAHGVSWIGRHGRGSFLDRFPLDDRVVVAASFAKGFGAGGACLVFSDPAELDLVRTSGGPLMFGGPMQPPMLGALRGSALVHLSPEIVELQDALRTRVDRINNGLEDAGIVPIAVNQSPIFFLQCGLPRVAFEVTKRMLDDGLLVNSSVFPSVPMKRGGIRLSVTAAHTFAEIDRAIDRLALHIPNVLRELGVADGQLAEEFANAIPRESVADAPLKGNGLRMQSATTIHQIDRATWDTVLGEAAHCSWDAMAAAERIYGAKDAPPEHRWKFRYLIVRDHTHRVVAATVFTTLLTKDDMLAAEDVSREIERRREADRYYLSSTVVMTGSTLSEGNHLYLDRIGPWREALRLILAAADEESERAGADAIMLRDLPDGDPEMDTFMLDEGFSRVPILDTHTLTLDAPDESAWYSALHNKKRYQLRRVIEHAKDTEVSFHGVGLAPLTDEEAVYLHGLFEQLEQKKFRINLFDLPMTLLPGMLTSPAWELGVVRIRAEAGGPQQPVGFWAAHKCGDTYAPFLLGVDDAYRDRDIYRVTILHWVRRACALSMRKVRMGMDAEVEKNRFGARAERIFMYLRTRDDYAGALLGEAVAKVATNQQIHQGAD